MSNVEGSGVAYTAEALEKLLEGTTTGPWETSGVRISGAKLSKDRLLQINATLAGCATAFVVYSDRRLGDHRQSHADQRLIAAAPSVTRALIESLREVERLRGENEGFRAWGIMEVAIRNFNVRSYMKHWEGRAEAAEAQVAELREALAVEINPTCPDCNGYGAHVVGHGYWPDGSENNSEEPCARCEGAGRTREAFEAMERALKPFAAAGGHVIYDDRERYNEDGWAEAVKHLTIGQFRAAYRAALSPKSGSAES